MKRTQSRKTLRRVSQLYGGGPFCSSRFCGEKNRSEITIPNIYDGIDSDPDSNVSSPSPRNSPPINLHEGENENKKEKLEKEKLEKEKLDKEKLEKERLEKDKYSQIIKNKLKLILDELIDLNTNITLDYILKILNKKSIKIIDFNGHKLKLKKFLISFLPKNYKISEKNHIVSI
jgi:hypothetical protein